MALKLVRKKKAKSASAGRKKKSEIEKFKNAIDVQLRLASGEKVKKGRGFAKSWMEDGKEYGVEKVLAPRVGKRALYSKSALVVDMKQKKPPTKELTCFGCASGSARQAHRRMDCCEPWPGGPRDGLALRSR